MTIQALRDLELQNGIRVKAGVILDVPDSLGAKLVEQGIARVREKPGPVERKTARDIPADSPESLPYTRIPAPPRKEIDFGVGYSDQDNFIRDLVTVLGPGAGAFSVAGGSGGTAPSVTPSGSAASRQPLLTLDLIKEHLKLDPDSTDEDVTLQQYEMAVRIHAENVLRYALDDPDNTGENIKQACLFLVAHFYRNREAVSVGKTSEGVAMPFAFMALLYAERDYPIY